MRHIKEYNQLFENTQELTQEQKNWLDECLCTKGGTWKVNPQTGLVDVIDSFSCSRQDLDSFKGVRFGQVSGYFSCSHNALTSLDGAPQWVGLYFSCSYNNLTSLEGGPQFVGLIYQCDHNSLTSLNGSPQKVGGSFDCSNNNLASLEGAPLSVEGSFIFSRNNVTSLDGAPQRVGRGVSCYGNPIGYSSMIGVIESMSKHGISLEEAVTKRWRYIPEEDRAYLAKYNPKLTPEEVKGYEALGRLKKRVI